MLLPFIEKYVLLRIVLIRAWLFCVFYCISTILLFLVNFMHPHIELTQFSPNNADSSFIAGGLVATDLYQEQIKESIESSKKVVEKYKAILNEKEVSQNHFFIFH